MRSDNSTAPAIKLTQLNLTVKDAGSKRPIWNNTGMPFDKA